MVKHTSKDISKIVRGTHGVKGIRGYVIYKGERYDFFGISEAKKDAAGFSGRLRYRGLLPVTVEFPVHDRYGVSVEYITYARSTPVPPSGSKKKRR